MKNALVNHNIAMTDKPSSSGLATGIIPEDFKQELFCWTIIKKAGQGVLNGNNVEYSLDYTVRGNGIFTPKLESALANRLFERKTETNRRMPVEVAPEYNPLLPVTDWKVISNNIKRHLPALKQASGLIHPALPAIFSMFEAAP